MTIRRDDFDELETWSLGQRLRGLLKESALHSSPVPPVRPLPQKNHVFTVTLSGEAGERVPFQKVCYTTFKVDSATVTDYPHEMLWLDADYCAYFADEEQIRAGEPPEPRVVTAKVDGEDVRLRLAPPPGSSTLVESIFIGADYIFPDLHSSTPSSEAAALLLGKMVNAGIPIQGHVTFLRRARWHLVLRGRSLR